MEAGPQIFLLKVSMQCIEEALIQLFLQWCWSDDLEDGPETSGQMKDGELPAL